MIPISDDPGPRRTVPLVMILILAVNVLVFLWQLTLSSRALDAFIFAFSVVPAALVGGTPQTNFVQNPLYHTPSPVYLTIFTSMFMHGGFLHIGGNMLFLWIFGDNVEDRMGHLGFLVFYLLCGVIASLAQVAIDPGSTIPSIGASGAIAGVLAAYLILFPRASVRALLFIPPFITVTTISALLMIGLWFVIQLFSGLGSLAITTQQGGVAYFAHVGGFVAGLLLVWVFRRKAPGRYSFG